MRSGGLSSVLSGLALAGMLAAATLLGGARPSEASPAAQQAVVGMTDDTNVFDPVEIVVPVGTTVTWVTNRGPIIHTVTSDVGLFDSGFIFNGQTFSFTFDTPGSYAYICTPHTALGMVGVVHVQ